VECVRASAPSAAESRRVRAALGVRRPWVTSFFVALNGALFLMTTSAGSGWSMRPAVVRDWTTRALPIDRAGEWWRIITGGFLHFDFRHLAMNMVMLYLLGRRLEQRVGASRFAGLYLCSLLGGSAGALVVAPSAATAGASGAIYGVMGAVYVVERLAGGDPWRDGLGSLILVNVMITFLLPGISIGGHIGGLAVGVMAGAVLGDRRLARRSRAQVIAWAALAALAMGSFVVALAAAAAM